MFTSDSIITLVCACKFGKVWCKWVCTFMVNAHLLKKRKMLCTLDSTDVMLKYKWKAVNERRWHHWPNTGQCGGLEECEGDERLQLQFTADKQTSILTVFHLNSFQEVVQLLQLQREKDSPRCQQTQGRGLLTWPQGLRCCWRVRQGSRLASPSPSSSSPPSSSSSSSFCQSDQWLWQRGFIKSQSGGGQQPDVTFKFPSCAAWGKDTWLWK